MLSQRDKESAEGLALAFESSTCDTHNPDPFSLARTNHVAPSNQEVQFSQVLGTDLHTVMTALGHEGSILVSPIK